MFRKINIFELIIAIFIILIQSIYIRTITTLYMSDSVHLSDGVYYLSIAFLSLVMLLLYSNKRILNINPIVYIVILFLGIQTIYLIQNSIPFIDILRLDSWGFVFIASYFCIRSYPKQLESLLFVIFVGLLINLSYLIRFEIMIRNSTKVGGLNVVYWLELGLPFAYLSSRKILRNLIIILIGIAVLLSLKMTAIISYLLAILFPIIVTYRRKNIISRLLLLSALIFVLIVWPYVSDYLDYNYNLSWLQKAEDTYDSGGSGRSLLWGKVIYLLYNSSITELLFGHGYNAVEYHLGLSAHNDFLEILYDYGLLMFIIYIFFCRKLYDNLKQLITLNHPYLPAFTCSLALFFTLSMFSHLIIYPGLLLNLSLLWSICILPNSRQRIVGLHNKYILQ